MSQKTVLCVWELGGDLGHLSRLFAVADVLEQNGYSVALALRDLSRVHEVQRSAQHRIFQAPVWLPKIRMQRPIACLADTLLLSGYLHEQALYSLVQGWRSLIDQLQPDAIIYDYAPTALLASAQMPLPKISIGSGFADPVPGNPLVDWRPQPEADGLVARQEQLVLNTVNRVRALLGEPALAQLADLFRVDASVMTALPLLDPYAAVRIKSGLCVGAHHSRYPRITFPDNGRPNLLAYLKHAHPQFRIMVQALGLAQCNVAAICPGVTAQEVGVAESTSLQWFSQMVNFNAALECADVMLGNGNSNTLTEAVCHGVPAVVCPVQLEQLLNGKALAESGAGQLLLRLDCAQDLVEAIHTVVHRPEYRTAARQQGVVARREVQPLERQILVLIQGWLGSAELP